MNTLASIPEEFRSQYEEMAEKLEENYNIELCAVQTYGYGINKKIFNDNWQATSENRKTLGLFLKQHSHELNSYMFPYFLGNNEGLDEMIKKEIRPKANVL